MTKQINCWEGYEFGSCGLHSCDLLRFKQMKNLINSDKTKVILDIGGGFYSIAKGVISKELIVLDGNDSFNPTIKADIEKPLPIKNSSIDIVIAGEIIEHLINPFRFLLEVNRILVKGGQLILSTPNECDLKSRIKVLFGRMPTNCAKPFPSTKDQRFGHKADYNWAILKEMLEKSGFKIVNKISTGIFLGNKLIVPSSICPIVFGEKFIVCAIAGKKRGEID